MNTDKEAILLVADNGLENPTPKVYITDFAESTHHTAHENGGDDEISVTGLSGLLADAQTPLAHALSHQDAGTDEISVQGLSGLLADGQTPLAHSTSHKNGGSDEVATATAAANAIPKAGAGATLAKEWLPQGAAIADASGGVVIDSEARTALNTLLARLRAGTVWLAT